MKIMETLFLTQISTWNRRQYIKLRKGCIIFETMNWRWITIGNMDSIQLMHKIKDLLKLFHANMYYTGKFRNRNKISKWVKISPNFDKPRKYEIKNHYIFVDFSIIISRFLTERYSHLVWFSIVDRLPIVSTTSTCVAHLFINFKIVYNIVRKRKLFNCERNLNTKNFVQFIEDDLSNLIRSVPN